jgi:polyketide cyclase/dehydrase/lipid transport protein
MPTSKSSVSIEASPDETFEFVRDVRNLHRYLSGVEAAAPAGGDAVRVTTDVDGTVRVGEAWVKVKEGRHRRIEWGTEGPASYHGWLEVDPEGEVCSITAELHDDRLPAADLDAALDETLFALKREIEGGRGLA